MPGLSQQGKQGGKNMQTTTFCERRTEARFESNSICYVRIFCRIRAKWVVYDGLIQDASDTHVRVFSDMPLASEFRIAHHDFDDVRRAMELRRDSAGVVFEIGEPVEEPKVSRIDNDFSFLEPLHTLLQETAGVSY
ncbi:MAG: hypothetical protein AB8G99_15170 [Planctomycetaceae bacterium]